MRVLSNLVFRSPPNLDHLGLILNAVRKRVLGVLDAAEMVGQGLANHYIPDLDSSAADCNFWNNILKWNSPDDKNMLLYVLSKLPTAHVVCALWKKVGSVSNNSLCYLSLVLFLLPCHTYNFSNEIFASWLCLVTSCFYECSGILQHIILHRNMENAVLN